jgi:hypothetical protein
LYCWTCGPIFSSHRLDATRDCGLQLCPCSPNLPRDASDGSWGFKSRLDAGRNCKNFWIDIAVAGAQLRDMKILRRVLWNIYALPITLLLFASYLPNFNHSGTLLFYHAVDFFVTMPALVALHLHIWDKKILAASFWKPYVFIFYAWDLSFNLLIEPTISGEKFDPISLIVPIILIPFYVALFRYAFRKWKVIDEPN